MNLLAIDTSTDHMSLAVTKAGKVVGKFHKKVDRNHSTLLIPMISRLLKRCRLKPEDLDGFCISIGPGSFTGLRIGVATVKALAFSLKKRIVTVPTLDVIAHNAVAHKGVICAVLDARKNKVYAALYRSDGKRIRKLSKNLLLEAKDLIKKLATYDNIAYIGDALHLIDRDPEDAFDFHPRAEIAAMLGVEQFAKGKFVQAEDLEPLYIYSRECDITGR
jgi:tRNA threonylcarbamoyladenosine biosynthesis protein TsaB